MALQALMEGWDWNGALMRINVALFLNLLFETVSPIALPFNPLGGASDLIVVEQPNGSLKTHPWFLSFGKLTLKEGQRLVSVAINGVLPNVTFNLPTDGQSGVWNFLWSSGKYEVRSIQPTGEQLAAMNLREGNNTITFLLESDIGVQKVMARVFCYKWYTRFVIEDLDGTITKSDVPGQVLPLLRMDWTQPGVTRLLSAIKDNGYEVLYLSARSISMADLTRWFLSTVEQDSGSLPDGPMVLCPDGLLSAFHREVRLKTPHEFKISMLQVIRDLFPPHSNPFFAGFGNRITDEASYKQAGIPEEKRFSINFKGVVSMKQGAVEVRETYDTLHASVNIYFPPLAHIRPQEITIARAIIPSQAPPPAANLR